MGALRGMIKGVSRRIAPAYTAGVERRRWHRNEARRLVAEAAKLDDLGRMVDLVRGHELYLTAQVRSEIVSFLEVVRRDRPRRICEIGTSFGGTLFLLCQAAAPDARVLSLDLEHSADQAEAFPLLGRPGQKVACLTRDSHRPETAAEVRAWLGGEPLDLLFIDGDHSYDGALADLDMYGPLVRPGGLVGMHDIHTDLRTRGGVATGNDVGEVPRLWADLAARFPDRMEWVEDPGQDGYGIGAFRWPGGAA